MPYNTDDSFTLPNGATNAFAGQTIASATWNAVNTDVQSALSHGLGVRSFAVRTVNFNPSVATDILINVSITSVRYSIEAIRITNASASLTSVTVGLFISPGAVGPIIASTTLTLSSTSGDSGNNLQVITDGQTNTRALSDVSVNFRIMVAQGSPATADVILYVRPL